MNEQFDLMAPMALAPKWTYRPATALSAPLVVAGDKLIGVSKANVFAVDIHTGKLAAGSGNKPWSLDLAGTKGRDPNVATSKGVVYLMDDDWLLAYKLGDGLPLASWPKDRSKTAPPDKKVPQAPQCKRLFVADGRVVAVNTDLSGATYIRGFDSLTGQLKFGPYPRNDKSPGRMAYGSKAIFFAAAGQLVALNVDNGDERWRFPRVAGSGVRLDGANEPLVTEKAVLAGGSALHAINPVTGAQIYKIEASAGQAVNWYTPVADIPKARVAATRMANLRAVRPLLGGEMGANVLHATVARTVSGTAVAVNAGGDIVGFSIADGAVVWRKKVSLPGPPVLIDGIVYLTTDDGKVMRQFDAKTGDATAAPFDLATRSAARPAVIANGSLFSVNDMGHIEAREFAVQHAAYFDGKGSHIKIGSAGAQYDFGAGDFTVEAWFRSSSGGEILSSHPTDDAPKAHGFRLKLEDGQVRVAVLNRGGGDRHVGCTAGTGADDGCWHHVAFARRSGEFVVTLDGISQVLNLAANFATDKDEVLSIGGRSAITIGAFIFPDIPTRSFFRGQIREVRVWNHAVDVVNIATNRDVELTGMEACLKGLWRLDEDQTGSTKKTPVNIAHRNREAAEFVNADSRVTDLTMDHSAFPYLLHEPHRQWPYAGTWGARGVYAATGSPTISSDGVAAFATPNAIYAVNAHDGRRVWSMDIPRTTSEPVADGGSFLVMTREDSLVRIDSKNGGKVQIEAFAGLPQDSDDRCAPPAVSPKYIAAASAGTNPAVTVWDRTSPKGQSATLAGSVVRIEIGDAGLVVLTREGTVLTLHLLEFATARVLGKRPVTSEAFCTAGAWVFGTDGNTVVKLARTALGGPPLATSAAMNGVNGMITGLVASADEDMLVATTATGHVCRMTLGTMARLWDQTVPAGPVQGRVALNPPLLDAQGRIICTSQSGSIIALDDETGRVMGLYSMEHSPLGRPALSAGGTVYVACEDSISNDAAENVDGALHSLVLGETTALRLNIDERGKGVKGCQHAVIDVPADDATLHLLEVHESCVEAWINAPMLAGNDGVLPGGGIVSILPSDQSGFDIHLWLEPDGTLHYSSRAKDNSNSGNWNGLHYSARTKLLDGKWHHIAASRTPPASAAANATDRVLIYIDGMQVEATRGAAPAAPAALYSGLKAYIGAKASDDLKAAMPFHGMIAEVRVWDTYLVATGITARMHVKLRGDEPDLIAYWNFDHGTVHDSAAQGHSGKLALLPVTDPVWWLTDLPFTQPSYPQIVSSASIAEEETETTTYALTLKVLAANGSGLAGQRVCLWYVKKKDSDPKNIYFGAEKMRAVKSSEEVVPILRDDGEGKDVWEGTTLSDGTLPLKIIVPRGSMPAIDMWTQFMPLNERFHVNVLLDNQKLARPAPPKLTAQAKLMQDYQYTTGGKVNDSRDRSTWRTVIRAASAADKPRPREPITLWASEPVTIEVNSRSYSVNKDNSVTLDTELDGELTLILPADDLTAPTLYARAGFMHREDRIVINPDQDAHSQLANISDKDLTTERTTNWKRPEDRKPGDKESLLPADARNEAPKVARAVTQVARAVKPADENAPPRSRRLSPAREKLLRMRPMSDHERNGLLQAGRNNRWRQPCLAAMAQPEPAPKSDTVVTRRTLAGMARMAPIDPEAFREAQDGALGFVFEKAAQKHHVIYRQLMTQKEVDEARGKAAPVLLHAPLLGGFFDDLWDGVKDVANKVAETVTKVVVTIADTIQLAVTTLVDGLERVVHSVVSSVKDALNAIANFFEQIGAAIAKVIQFLRALFDWGNIIETQKILRDIFNASLTISSHGLKNTGPLVAGARRLAGMTAAPKFAGAQSMNAVTNNAPEKESSIAANANSVQGKSMTQKTQTTPALAVESGSTMPDGAAEPTDMFLIIANSLPKLADSILDLSPEDLFRQLQEIARKAAQASLVASVEAVAGLMGTLATTMDWTKEILNAKVNIPFISELYEWITGQPLTILNVLCLAMAVPVNIAYAVFTAVTGNVRFFFDDGKNIARQMLTRAGLAPAALPQQALADGGIPRTSAATEFCLILMRSLATAADFGVDNAFVHSHGRGRTPTVAEQSAVGLYNVMQGVTGTIALSLQTFATQPVFEERVRYVVKDRPTDFIPRYQEISYTVYGLLMALRANKLRAGIMFYKEGPNAPPGVFSELKDKYEYPIALGVSTAVFGLLIYQIIETTRRYPELQAYGNPDLADQYKFLAVRDMLGMTAAMFEFMYTERGARQFRRAFPGPALATNLYATTALVRFGCNATSIVMEGIAAYKYGDPDNKD